MDKRIIEKLIKEAIKVREVAYAPYSGMKVGAALWTKKEKIYSGCNIENSAFSPSLCAERSALAQAISKNEKDFLGIAIIGYKEKAEFCPPCGVCLQVLSEFCDPETFQIIIAKNKNTYQEYLLKELLPYTFKYEKDKE